MNQLLSQNNGHIFICGQTRSGKTYFAGRALRQLKYPVLFFNIQDEKLPGFMKVAVDNIDFTQLLEVLKAGEKIDLRFPPGMRLIMINRIVGYILDQLMVSGFAEKNPVYVALDECHTLDGPGKISAIQVATRGLSRGIRAVFITQRPALCDKTLYTQATEQYLFYLSPAENQYIKNKGLNFEECQNTWHKNGQYSYVYYDGMVLEGRRAAK